MRDTNQILLVLTLIGFVAISLIFVISGGTSATEVICIDTFCKLRRILESASVQARTSALLAESVAIGPGSSLQLQTSQGPMTLTVDSPMNGAGYVHAYGFKNGVEYAGFVKLMSAGSPVAQAQGPEYVAPSQAYNNAEAPMTLKISADGSASIDGHPVLASNTRTASVLRLLAKKAVPELDFTESSPIDSEIIRAKAVLSRLEAARRSALKARPTMLSLADDNSNDGRDSRPRLSRRAHTESRQAMLAAMQSLMKSVSRIERKEDRMEKVVDKVCPSCPTNPTFCTKYFCFSVYSGRSTNGANPRRPAAGEKDYALQALLSARQQLCAKGRLFATRQQTQLAVSEDSPGRAWVVLLCPRRVPSRIGSQRNRTARAARGPRCAWPGGCESRRTPTRHARASLRQAGRAVGEGRPRRLPARRRSAVAEPAPPAASMEGGAALARPGLA